MKHLLFTLLLALTASHTQAQFSFGAEVGAGIGKIFDNKAKQTGDFIYSTSLGLYSNVGVKFGYTFKERFCLSFSPNLYLFEVTVTAEYSSGRRDYYKYNQFYIFGNLDARYYFKNRPIVTGLGYGIKPYKYSYQNFVFDNFKLNYLIGYAKQKNRLRFEAILNISQYIVTITNNITTPFERITLTPTISLEYLFKKKEKY